MATAGITEEAIQQMIQDAVVAALASQAATHRQDMDAQAARLQCPSSSAAPSSPASSAASSTRSTVPRTRLNMSSPSLVYYGLGGTSTSVLSHLHLPLRFLLRRTFINF